MRVIGVTGGVGAGKSTVLGILEEDFQAYVIQADQLGHILMEPGEECYDAVIALFGKEIIKDKTIDRRRISDMLEIKRDHPSGCKAEKDLMLLKEHPAVKGEQEEAGENLCCGSCSFLEENYQNSVMKSGMCIQRRNPDPSSDGKPAIPEISWHYPETRYLTRFSENIRIM